MDSISSDPSIAQRVVLAKEAFDKVLRIISEPDISFGERGRFINELQKYVEEILPQSVISGNAGAVSFKSKLLEKIETFKKNSTSSLHMRTHTYIDRDRDRGRGRGIQQPTIYAPVLADLRDGSDSLLLEDLGAIVQRREDAVLQARLFGGIREVMHLRNLSNSRAP
jgi:hypothetical protein